MEIPNKWMNEGHCNFMCQWMLEVAPQWGTNYVYSHSHSNQDAVLTGFLMNRFSFLNKGTVSLSYYTFSIHFILFILCIDK